MNSIADLIEILFADYLKEQQLDKAYHEFCKSSPYLCEEYSLLKQGYKPKQIKNFSLMDLVREYSEASEICKFISRNTCLDNFDVMKTLFLILLVDCLIQKQAEVCDSDEVPKLFGLSLKEKFQYIYRAKPSDTDQSFTKNTTNQKRR